MRPSLTTITSLTLFTSLALAQQAPTPTIQVYSRETVVDVVVTDSKGLPVHNLKQSDFSVEEDGKPQSIRSFKEFNAGTQAERRVLPKLPSGVYSNVGATPATGPVYIFLIDVMDTSPDQVVIEKKLMAEYLKSVPQSAEIAVFALSPNKGLLMVQAFTSDSASVATRIDAIDPEYLRPPSLPVARMVIESFNHIAAYVVGIKGRKNLLWFTSQMPIKILRDGGYDDGDPPPLTSFHEVSELYDSLTAQQVAVYPVDTTTLRVFENEKQQRDEAHLRLLMERVAEQTGGAAYYNTNDLGSVMGKVFDRGSNFYTLSYVPPQFADDGRYHGIEIKVNKPGLHLVYRKGFNAANPKDPTPAPGPKMMQAAMGGGAPPVTQLLFDVRVQSNTDPRKPTDPQVMGMLDAKLKNAPLTRYGFLYLVPMTEIGFADGSDGTHRGALEFDVVAYDADGKMVNLISQTLQLPLTKDEYADFVKKPFQFFQQIDLPPGQFTLRVGILDGVSNKIGTLEIPLTVPKP